MGKLREWWSYKSEDEGYSGDSVHKPLPFEQRRKALPLLILGFTWGFLITGLLIGGTIGPSLPFYGGTIPATLIGCFVLFVVSVLTGMVGYKIGGTNDMAFQYAYGKVGRRIPAAFLVIVVLGFQGVVVGGTATFWLKDTEHPAFFWVALLFGALFTYTCYVGIRLIEKISNQAMILLVMVSAYALFYNINKIGGWDAFNTQTVDTAVANGVMPMATAINLVIGSWIAGAVLTSDFTRFARNKWVAVGMLSVCFFFTQVLLVVLGAIGAVISNSYDFTQYLYEMSPIVGFIALIAMTLAMWTSSNTNLYLPSSQVASVFKRPFKVAVVICGTIGTLLGAFGFFAQFSSFINGIAVIIPPLVGPMIADFWIIHRTKYKAEYLECLPKFNLVALISAGAGIALTVLSTGLSAINLQPLPLLSATWIVPSILGIFVSVVVYVVVYYALRAVGIKSGYTRALEVESEKFEVLVQPSMTKDM